MTWARCLYLSCCFQTTSKPAPRSKWTTTSSTSTVLLSAFILPPVICTDFCGSHDWSACMFLSVIADLFREQRFFSTYNSFKTTIAAAITSDNMRKNSQKDERNNNLARLYMHCAILSRLCWKKKKKIQYSISEMEMLHHNTSQLHLQNIEFQTELINLSENVCCLADGGWASVSVRQIPFQNENDSWKLSHTLCLLWGSLSIRMESRKLEWLSIIL